MWISVILYHKDNLVFKNILFSCSNFHFTIYDTFVCGLQYTTNLTQSILCTTINCQNDEVHIVHYDILLTWRSLYWPYGILPSDAVYIVHYNNYQNDAALLMKSSANFDKIFYKITNIYFTVLFCKKGNRSRYIFNKLHFVLYSLVINLLTV